MDSHYDIQPLIDIYGSVQGRDLGGVATDIKKIVDSEEGAAARFADHSSRTNSDHAFLLFRLAGWPGVLHRPGVLADCGEFPILAGSIHHYFCVARIAGGNCLVPVRHAHHHQRARPHWLHHVRGGGNREQHSGGELRQGADG